MCVYVSMLYIYILPATCEIQVWEMNAIAAILPR